ncbi:UDP-glucose 4-epimerase [Candidatus Hakubella thermalkaliphila]|uniref:UDP-glucose 4-epimerase n=1 Tax=Candidatus Hakubella thermalkaliphila TaxID=2754717 RepID=A0A6V8PKA2_9ACTN|nr:UDP-glucose 4-epimerase [Candidatus Hakubella thermalkaliphila]
MIQKRCNRVLDSLEGERDVKILVTGGAGFIGSHVVDRYIQDGHTVTVVDDLSTGDERNLNPEAYFFKFDIRDSDLEELFAYSGFDVVNHHAAQIDVRKSVGDPRHDAGVNIVGSINLLECSRKHSVKKFIYISTGGAVYGEPAWLPVQEDHPINPKCHYGISKHTAEHYLHLYSILYGLRYTIFRYPNVYGPRQNPYGEAGVNAIFIGKMLSGECPTIFGDGEQLRDYVYIDDIVEANVLALTAGDNEVFNLGSGVGTSVNEIFQLLKKMIGFSGRPHYAPLRPGEIRQIYLDSSKARRMLGWEVKTDLKEGLQRTVEWFRDNDRWKF